MFFLLFCCASFPIYLFCSILVYFCLLSVCLFLFAYLLFKERKRKEVCNWQHGNVERIWEEMGRRNLDKKHIV